MNYLLDSNTIIFALRGHQNVSEHILARKPIELFSCELVRAEQMTLVTNHTKELSRVPNLQIKDWTNKP